MGKITARVKRSIKGMKLSLLHILRKVDIHFALFKQDVEATGNAILSEVSILKGFGYEHFNDITRKVEKFFTICTYLIHTDLPPIFNLSVIPSKAKEFLNNIADCFEGIDEALKTFLERLKYPGWLDSMTRPPQQMRKLWREEIWVQSGEPRAINFPPSWEADEQDILITLSWWRKQLKQEISALRETFYNYQVALVPND
ncbi:hypothetical protein EV426DRAFT_709880 [Tirmania nivea]|nr:hypothetical protein EV426DRAFT_709880 [Tirmania nivea]